jgi:glycosyltransferase involved in cell wall biosynthesis
MFKVIYGVDEYILWLGIIEQNKNQLFCIEALKDIDTPVVFLGNYRDRTYYEACRKAAPKHFKFLPSMPAKSEILRSALQNCKLYLEAPLEPPGHSSLEAGLAGVPLVLSDDAWSREQFRDSVVYVDPKSSESIFKGVEMALGKGNDSSIAGHIRRRHLYPQCLEPLIRVLQGFC